MRRPTGHQARWERNASQANARLAKGSVEEKRLADVHWPPGPVVANRLAGDAALATKLVGAKWLTGDAPLAIKLSGG